MTDKEIEEQVRKEAENLPDGCYEIQDNLYVGKEGLILFEIEFRKIINGYKNDRRRKKEHQCPDK